MIITSISGMSQDVPNNDSIRGIIKNEDLPDSVRFKAIQNFYNLNSDRYPDETLLLVDYHLNLAQIKNSKTETFKAYNNLGSIYLDKDDLDMAKRFYTNALEISKEIQDSSKWALVLGNIGIIHGNRGEYVEAVRCYSKTLEYYQNSGNKVGEGRSINNLGGIHQIIGDYDVALEYYKKALELVKVNEKEGKNTVIAYLNIGSVSLENNQIEDALAYFNQAKKICLEINNRVFEAASDHMLCKAYMKNKEYPKAVSYCENCVEINEELGFLQNAAMNNLSLAEIKSEVDPKNAITLVRKSEPYLKNIENNRFKVDYYNLLYRCYKSLGEPKEALNMYELSVLYEDSLQLEENRLVLIREAVKKDYEIQIYENQLESEKIQSSLKLKQQRRIFLILGGSALLILFILYRVKLVNVQNAKVRGELLQEIEQLKRGEETSLIGDLNSFALDRDKVEYFINRELNETDWNVLNVLLENPVIENKVIAEKVFKSLDGVGSSLRRMYTYFEITGTKYKKISLLMKVVKISSSK